MAVLKFLVQILAVVAIILGVCVMAGLFKLWAPALVWFVLAIALNTLTLPDDVPRRKAAA